LYEFVQEQSAFNAPAGESRFLLGKILPDISVTCVSANFMLKTRIFPTSSIKMLLVRPVPRLFTSAGIAEAIALGEQLSQQSVLPVFSPRPAKKPNRSDALVDRQAISLLAHYAGHPASRTISTARRSYSRIKAQRCAHHG
jgi:hypothetical protein